MAAYDTIADFYDVWTSLAEAPKHDLEFYAAHALGQGDRPVIELGIGSGRVGVELARRGAMVIGVDESVTMLGAANRRAASAGVADRVLNIAADFSRWIPAAGAAVVIAPFHALSHLPDLAAIRRTFGLVHAALAPGGRFLFNIPRHDPVHAAEVDGVRQVVADADIGGSRLCVDVTVEHDWSARRQTSRVRGSLTSGGGDVLSSHQWDLPLVWLTAQQVENEAALAGFVVEWGEQAFADGGQRFPLEQTFVLVRD